MTDALPRLLAAVRAHVGDADPTLLADAAWLAASRAAATDAEEAPGPEASGGPKPDRPATGPRTDAPGDPAPPPAARPAPVSVRRPDGTTPVRGVPLSVQRPAPLPEALALARALRPFRRPWPGGTRARLDLDATIDHYARSGTLVPVFSRAPERWFEVILVVDTSVTMALWEDLAQALSRLMHGLGAFRAVHTWRLTWQDLEPRLHDHRGHTVPSHRAAQHSGSPRGRRLILVLTDCAAPGWRRDEPWHMLRAWGRSAPLALVDPLPRRLWHRSALDHPPCRAVGPYPAAPTAALRPADRASTGPLGGGQVLPTLTPTPHSLRAWAHTVMRADAEGCEAVVVPPGGRPRRQRDDVDAPSPAAMADAFVRTAPPAAVRLAVLASTLNSFTVPMLKVLRERALPETRLSDLAEVLSSGLVTVSRETGHEPVLGFTAAAQERLHRELIRRDARLVHQAMSAHLADHPHAPHGIQAVLHSPEAASRLPADLRPFAEAGTTALRMLGLHTTSRPTVGGPPPVPTTARAGADAPGEAPVTAGAPGQAPSGIPMPGQAPSAVPARDDPATGFPARRQSELVFAWSRTERRGFLRRLQDYFRGGRVTDGAPEPVGRSERDIALELAHGGLEHLVHQMLDPGPSWSRLWPDDPRQAGPYRLYARYLGGWSQVVMFLGLDTEGGTVTVRVPLSTAPEVAESLIRTEAEALTRLAGAHAPRLLGHSVEDSPPWIAAECAHRREEGGPRPRPAPNLRLLLEERGALEAVALLRLGRDLAEALRHAHGAGLVHGSLAPHCVLLPDRGVQLVGWMTASVDGVPSPLRDAFRRDVDFEAREAQGSLGVTMASDVYAVGAILFTAATGQWAGRLSSGTARDAWERASLDGTLGDVLSGCLDPDPAARPTAAELAGAFADRAGRRRPRVRRERGPVPAQDAAAWAPVPPERDRRWFPARDTFTLGGRVTDCHLYEGDGTRAIPERNVLVHHLAEHVDLPAEVRGWRAEIEAEEARKAAAGEPHRWNSPRFALEGITVARTADQGEPVVHLKLRDADYYDFLAASLNLDRPRPGDGLTLRRLHLENRDPVHAPAFLSSSFGVIVAVETGSDGKMLFARSSPYVAGHPRRWNASVSEGLSGAHDLPSDGSPISFHATARRALREELGVTAEDRVELELLAFGLDLRLHQWAAFFRAVLPDLGEEDLRRRWARGVEDKWEHDSHAFVPADPDSVLDFILEQPDRAWAPCAPALFYLALVRGAVLRRGGDPAGRLDVEAAERRARRRHGEAGPAE